MSERDQIHQYLKSLSRYLSALDKTEAEEVLREIESHIFDAIDIIEQRGEIADAAVILDGFGPPRQLAQSYVRHIQHGAPPPAGFAAISTVKRGVTNTLYYGMALFGFAIATALIITALANLMVPDSVGVWSVAGGNSIVIGLFNDPLPPGDEISGFWYTPIALLLGYAIIRLTVGVMQVLKRQLVR